MAKKIKLKSGDIDIDTETNAVGVLVYRYTLVEGEEPESDLWAWDIYWTGPDMDVEERMQPWTEFGLRNIIKNGLFKLVKLID